MAPGCGEPARDLELRLLDEARDVERAFRALERLRSM
jgi:hypothetical protein